MNRIIRGIILVITILTPMLITYKAHASVTDIPELDVFSAILIDAETGQILYEDNSDADFYIGGLTKMMVEYIVLEELDKEKVVESAIINPSTYTFSYSWTGNNTKYWYRDNMILHPGTEYPFIEIFKYMVVTGANDATVALAEYLGNKNEQTFVSLMNDKATMLGIDTNFYNTTGLNTNEVNNIIERYNNSDPMPYEPSISTEFDNDKVNEMTAKEAATIAYRLLNDFPRILDYTTIDYLDEDRYNENYETSNQNGMLDIETQEPYSHAYSGVKGLITGTYLDEVNNLTYYSNVTYVEKDNGKFLSVIFHKYSGEDLSKYTEDACKNDVIPKHVRYIETKNLLDYAYSLDKVEISNTNLKEYNFNNKIPVYKGNKNNVTIGVEQPLFIYVNDINSSNINLQIEYNDNIVDNNGRIVGTIEKDSKVGTIKLLLNDKEVKYISQHKYNQNDSDSELVTLDFVGRPNIFKLIWIFIVEIINKFINWIIYLF